MTTFGALVLLAVLVVGLHVHVNLRRFRPAPAPAGRPVPVAILVPARDEAAGIEEAVRAACAQTVAGLEVVVLDDGSTDGTGAILARLAAELPRLRVVVGAPLPPGWAGKAWACWQLAREAQGSPWLLFVDADVRLDRGAAARMLALAEAENADYVSGFPRQVLGSAGEALIVPLMHLLLLAYLPLSRLRRSPRRALAAGCGQLMLVRRVAYLAAGGHRAIAGTLHDGLQLARRMKAAGFAISVFDATDLARCRMYHGFRATWRGFARNAYEALGSPAVLAVMVGVNAGLFVLPALGLAGHLLAGGGMRAAAPWAAALLVGAGLRLRLARRFGAPAWTALATPVAVALLIGIQLHSFMRHWRGRPVVWRTREYPGATPVGRI